jgi:hypothetical protein
MTEVAPTLWSAPPQQQQQQQQQGLSAPPPWFEAAIQTAVKHLGDSAPLLVVVDTHPGLSIRVLQLTTAQASISWTVLQTSLGISNSSATILVQPVPSADDVCAAASGSCPMAGSGSAGATCPSAAAAAGGAAEVISGRVGDCCDGSDSHGSHEAAGADATASTNSSGSKETTSFWEAWDKQRRAQGLPTAATAAAAASSQAIAYDGSITERRFYGLVVQSQQQQHLQGCYLLKVSRTVQRTHSTGGCACTHYSLNRVCQNVPLRQQYVDSWLV